MSDTHRPTADWIAVDWGTSHLRAWAMDTSGTQLWSGSSDQGMGVLAPAQFEDALLDVVGPVLGDAPVDVVACGMVGSRQGWVEAPYAATPCPALPTGFARPTTQHPLLRVHVIPGVKQEANPDVMRGEETQIAGFLALNPGWDGVLCLPGTHTKWAQVSAGEIVSFRTFMTGELFALLGERSVLRHSVADTGWDDAAFEEAVSTTMSKPESFAAQLFSLRAGHLLNGLEGAAARARLSGLLIGAELAAARPYWLGQQVAVVGAPAMSRIYGAALEAQGGPAMIADGARMTLAGLTAAYKSLRS
ncbi:MAG: 2-dehydro-3-deoxygalactonokinase [Pseudomonadota bacterium]